MCRKPALTINPKELISPCSSALVATVVPWARPATSSVVAPAAARISLTPRNRPIAGLAGVLATLVTCVAPDCVSTDTMSGKVPPVSIPIRNRAAEDRDDMPGTIDKLTGTCACQPPPPHCGSMGRTRDPSQKPIIDDIIGKSDQPDLSISRNFNNAVSL